MRRKARVATAMACTLALLTGCAVFLPETWDDMDSQVDSLVPPGRFELIGKGRGGSRAALFGGADVPPSVERHYSVPWDDGRLCERLHELAAGLGHPIDQETAHIAAGGAIHCGYSIFIGAGWRARLVNVHKYRLTFMAKSPEQVRSYPSDERCRKDRVNDSAVLRGSPLYRINPQCWVAPGESLFTVELLGKHGW
jgi:hypothetical protein